MKILGIGLGTPDKKIQNTNKIAAYKNYFPVTKPYALDSVSFKRTAGNAERMRSLFKYGIIDIHTGQYVIDPDWFQEALQNGFFNRTIHHIVRTLKPWKDRLHKVELELFEKLEETAKTYPLYRLDEALQSYAPTAQVRLLNLQKPVFEELKQQSKSLPEEQKAAFYELMSKTENQLANKPITYKFSKKEFKYQLERIAQGIKRRGLPEEVKCMDKLIKMSERLPYTPSGRNFSRRKPNFDPNKSLTQANMIRVMNNYLMRSTLGGDKELNDLFCSAKKQIFNIPFVIPFKRKTFLHELDSILDTLDDTKLAREMSKTASNIPTASEELSAFIMKSSRNSSTKIGYDLIYGSVGSIDHLVPWSHGGADSLENYGFTSNALNSKRGNMVISKWLKNNPETYIGSQKCVDRLIELYRDGTLAKEEFTPWYMVNFAKKMKKLSPADKPLELNLGTLQDELIKN